MTIAVHLADIVPVATPTSYAAISARVFNGEILKFGGGTRFVRAARALCRRAFSTPDPTRAHLIYDKDEFLRRAAAAQQEFNTAFYKDLFKVWLQAAGIAIGDLYWDTLGLRVAPPINTHAGGFRSYIAVHRDTWGTSIQAQINWWAPLWHLADGRTMAFYPDYWTRPLNNTTAAWSFKEYLASRKQSAGGRAAAYPSAPRALESAQTPPAVLRLKCGDLTAFAAAHLHASVPNRTAKTRFSMEIRTVRLQDIRHERGAPNVDSHSQPPLYQLFRSVADDVRLQQRI